MTSATVAVKGSASDDYPADYAIAHFGNEFNAPSRSETLTGGNAVIAQFRDTVAKLGAGVREMKVQSLRVQENFNYVDHDRVRQSAGWVAQLGGEILIEPDALPAAYARLIQTGVRIYYLTWHLDLETERQAHRAVRRLAVADAREAANDFALAIGGNLGSLITLADPGLLSAGDSDFEVRGPPGMRRASAASGAGTGDEYVDLDPEVITIWANVEATYEVTLP